VNAGCIPETARDRAKLSIRSLGMVFRSEGKETPVLENVDLDVHEGELVCILGPSGCGKSTLLNIVGGFLAPTSGAVTIDEEPVTSVTLPTRPPSPVTGSFTETPLPDPASTSTV